LILFAMPTPTAAFVPASHTIASLTALQLIDRSRQGLAGAEADRVARLLGVSDKEMAPLLNLSVATFHRQTKQGRLDAATSERLLLLERLAQYGAAVFQDADEARPGKFTSWLRRPLRLLGDRAPLALLDSPTGVQLVEDILGRIEYGVFS
jgi:putative toxin-antitoxin system antitoxin component (TIGR02293 family)